MLKNKVVKFKRMELEFLNNVDELHNYIIDINDDWLCVSHIYKGSNDFNKHIVNRMSHKQFKEFVSRLVEISESL